MGKYGIMPVRGDGPARGVTRAGARFRQEEAANTVVPGCTMRFRLARQPTAPREARRRIRPELEQLGYVEDVVDELLVAVGEAVTNAVLYGGGSGADRITITLRTDDTACTIDVTSRSAGWTLDPPVLPVPTAEHGRGLYIIDRFTDGWEIRQDRNGSTVSLKRRLPAPAAERAARS
jgi:anti-sigma regulatory factor (Ser/Thr protein kinase)